MSLRYKDAGVDIHAGNQLVERIKPIAKRTLRPGVLGGLGGFGGLFELPLERYPQPILVSATDGVGTKLKLASALHQHDTIGIDLVAMCANDIIVQGAEPLFFLDYFACGHLDVDATTRVINGIGEGCQQAGIALLGGETAEMPGMYSNDDYDLAGFCVGIANKDRLIDGSHVMAGDRVIGLYSSGVHSNGFSLVRKILDYRQLDLHGPFADSTLGATLLTPTRIYVKSLLALLQQVPVHAMAHITGGGLLENIPRVLPQHLAAEIQVTSWELPLIFRYLQEQGQVAKDEMWRTFNCGIGMVVVVAAAKANEALTLLQTAGEQAQIIGRIAPRHKEAVILY